MRENNHFKEKGPIEKHLNIPKKLVQKFHFLNIGSCRSKNLYPPAPHEIDLDEH